MRFDMVHDLARLPRPGYITCEKAVLACLAIGQSVLCEQHDSDAGTKARAWSSYLHKVLGMIDNLSDRGMVAVTKLAGLIKRDLLPQSHIQDLVRQIAKIGDDAKSIEHGALKALTKTATANPDVLASLRGDSPTGRLPSKTKLD